MCTGYAGPRCHHRHLETNDKIVSMLSSTQNTAAAIGTWSGCSRSLKRFMERPKITKLHRFKQESDDTYWYVFNGYSIGPFYSPEDRERDIIRYYEETGD